MYGEVEHHRGVSYKLILGSCLHLCKQKCCSRQYEMNDIPESNPGHFSHAIFKSLDRGTTVIPCYLILIEYSYFSLGKINVK